MRLTPTSRPAPGAPGLRSQPEARPGFFFAMGKHKHCHHDGTGKFAMQVRAKKLVGKTAMKVKVEKTAMKVAAMKVAGKSAMKVAPKNKKT